MRVRLLVPRATLAGPEEIGDEIDVSDAEAIRMIEAGQAEVVRSVKPQRAVRKTKTEKAVK